MPTYLDFLNEVVQDDVVALRKAEESYGDSWKKRGGVGAFMMLARKWDRIERQLQKPDQPFSLSPSMTKIADKWDIVEHLLADKRPEGLTDDIRDLRRYLLLCQANHAATLNATNGTYLDHLEPVCEKDLDALRAVNDHWRKRGGIGLFFLLAEGWDKLENALLDEPVWDIFTHMRAGSSVTENVRWLRRYLLLIEAEMRSR